MSPFYTHILGLCAVVFQIPSLSTVRTIQSVTFCAGKVVISVDIGYTLLLLLLLFGIYDK